MKIKDIFFRKIYDSRGNPTLEVELLSKEGFSFVSSVPAGKSKSKKEAVCLNFQKILSNSYYKKIITLKNRDFKSIKSFDNFLLKLDGTRNKSKLGGNVILGLSLSFARALAFEKKVSLSSLVEEEFFNKNKNVQWRPVIYSNFINGGEHSSNNLDIQEYLVLAPLNQSPEKTVESLIKFYRLTGEFLAKNSNIKSLSIGDEGGYALDFKDNFEPLFILENLIKKNNFSSFALGIDVAANSFWNGKYYFFEGQKLNSDKMGKVYDNYFRKLERLESIEDPFAEEDEKNFKLLKERLGGSKIVVGDDLTSSQALNLYKYKDYINGIIIKPNQVGTITETMETCNLAKSLGINTIFSHRSGETEDPFIVELAYAARAFGIKIGAPIKERMVKFNEIIRILS